MSTVPALCDRTIRWGLVGLIAFTPLAFGTVEPWSIALMEWGIITLVLTFILGRIWPSTGQRSARWRATGLEVSFVLFLLLGVLQTVPLPLSWLRAFAPGSARMYEQEGLSVHEGVSGLGESQATSLEPLMTGSPSGARPVSVDPGLTRDRLLLLAASALLFLLVSAWADSSRKIVFLLGTVTVVGFLVAFEGLVQFLTWNGKIYWVRRVPPSPAFGPFVNHNHFAGYVEMVIPVAISLAFYLIELRRRPHPEPGDRWGLDALTRGAGDLRGRWGKAGLALFAAVVLVVSLILCMSRGGTLSALISGLILFLIVWRRIASRLLAWSVAVALPCLVIGLAAWIGVDVVKKHLGSYPAIENEASFRYRAMVWGSMLEHLPDFLWTGSGLGTFEPSFAPFVPPGSAKRWDKAHNDYLQILWETGIAGTLLLLAGGCIFVRRYWWPAMRSGDHPLGFFRVGAAVSLMSIALHSLVDFNLQIGANGFLFFLLAGLLVALHRVVERDQTRPAVLKTPLEAPA